MIIGSGEKWTTIVSKPVNKCTECQSILEAGVEIGDIDILVRGSLLLAPQQ